MLAEHKTNFKELAEAIGITEQNLSLIKTGMAKGLCLATLGASCR